MASSSNEQTCLVIPCFREEKTIAAVVSTSRQWMRRVIVVDDGSDDQTAIRAEEAGAEVIRHSTRRGKGHALHTGLEAARKAGFLWCITMDGDGQHSTGDLPRFLDFPADIELLIGNRMGDPQEIPCLRRQTNRLMSFLLSWLTGRKLWDSQCGFRRVSIHAWKQLAIEASQFEVESEFIIRMAEGGKRIEFVPITVIYGTEKSKIRPFKDTWRWIAWFFRALPRRGECRGGPVSRLAE